MDRYWYIIYIYTVYIMIIMDIWRWHLPYAIWIMFMNIWVIWLIILFDSKVMPSIVTAISSPCWIQSSGDSEPILTWLGTSMIIYSGIPIHKQRWWTTSEFHGNSMKCSAKKVWQFFVDFCLLRPGLVEMVPRGHCRVPFHSSTAV